MIHIQCGRQPWGGLGGSGGSGGSGGFGALAMRRNKIPMPPIAMNSSTRRIVQNPGIEIKARTSKSTAITATAPKDTSGSHTLEKIGLNQRRQRSPLQGGGGGGGGFGSCSVGRQGHEDGQRQLPLGQISTDVGHPHCARLGQYGQSFVPCDSLIRAPRFCRGDRSTAVTQRSRPELTHLPRRVSRQNHVCVAETAHETTRAHSNQNRDANVV